MIVFGPESAAGAAPSTACWLRARSPGGPVPAQGVDLVFNDIAESRPGLVAPDAALIARALAAPLPALVTCFAGVSRSTALAYALACRARPGAGQALAEELRALAPWATPNPLVVALADAALGAGGAMIAAIASIGRGAEIARGGLVLWRPGKGGDVLVEALGPLPQV
ncbi:MAG: hypothetical protein K2X73_07850 [Sphingomonas sp.]|uniref:hypothetical protein n=1 Tax=Sphingomonas sp. TaxID=28214 RepID=UPI0025CFDCF9|nr:hypothetical protein [Sphingomonas sp.]MBX9881871.1 hypothetical protein [Sphingomonas sp.]